MMPPPKTIFHVALHPDDAAHVMRLSACCGLEVCDFLAIAAVRYVDLVERGIDAPGRCDKKVLERRSFPDLS